MISRAFGSLPSGEAVKAFTLANASGASAEILTYGSVVRALRMPDREGRLADVVLGFDRLEPYLAIRACFGAVVGRIAGRVTGGRLSIDGRACALACNDGSNHLHGGVLGLDRRLWVAEAAFQKDGAASVRLSYRSPDGEEGYPGNVDIAATYTLTAANELIFETEAAADRATPISLTQHSYFNLAGDGCGRILDHVVQVFADEFVPIDGSLTLLDRRERVRGTGADLTQPRPLRDALPNLLAGHGDHYPLRGPDAAVPREPTLAAEVAEPGSGRVLQVLTDNSSLQFYTGYALDGAAVGKSGRPYGPYAGFCMECEGYPNASTVGGFGDIMVRPGRPQRRRTVFAFSTF